MHNPPFAGTNSQRFVLIQQRLERYQNLCSTLSPDSCYNKAKLKLHIFHCCNSGLHIADLLILHFPQCIHWLTSHSFVYNQRV